MERRVNMRAAKHKRRGWAVVWALAVVLVATLWGGGTFLLNQSPLPELLAARMDSGLETQLGPGYQVDVSRPRFVAPNQVYVDMIRVTATAAGSNPVALSGLQVFFRWRELAGELFTQALGRAQATASPAAAAGSAGPGNPAGSASAATPASSGAGGSAAGASLVLPLPVSAISLRELTLDIAQLPPRLWQAVSGSGQEGPGAEIPPPPGREDEGQEGQGLAGISLSNRALAGLLHNLLRWQKESRVDLAVQTLELRRAGEQLLRLSGLRLLPVEGGLEVRAKTDWRRAKQPEWPVRALVSWKISILSPLDKQDPELPPRLAIEGGLAGPGEIRSGDWSVQLERASLIAFWQGEELYVDRLLLADGETRVNLEGVLRPGADGDWRKARLALAVAAEGVRLPEQLAFLASYGIAGTADLTGRLEGSWSDPVLSGTVTGERGRLFHRPFRKLTGEIQVDRESFVFHDATVIGEARAGGAQTRYSLEGKITYARPEWGRPAALEVAVATGGGRVEEWLPAFVPALAGLRGEVRGFLRVNGLVGDLGIGGQLELSEGDFRNIPFDFLRGRFRWRPERLRLETVELHLGTVQVAASGNAGPEGLLAMDVMGREVPLELIYALAVPSAGAPPDIWSRLAAGIRQWQRGDLGLSQPVSGHVNLSGRVTGSLARPAFTATVSSTRLRIGPVEFSRSSGQLSWDGEDLTIPLLYLNRANGGTYNLQGVVHGLRQIPSLDMQLEVDGEPVPELIEVLGGPARDLRLAQLALAEGWFYGRARVTGSLAKPRAVAVLSLDRGRILGRPLQLRLDLSYADGKVRVERVNPKLSLATVAPNANISLWAITIPSG